MLEIPLIDNKGREVVAKWTVHDFDNDQTFYTDSNSLEMQKRVLDYRPDFTLNTTMKVNNNYYPVNSAIAMRSNNGMQVTVVNQHSQGGSSIENGSLELMQNRRLLHDDNKGVTEPLNETQADGRGIAVNSKYWLSFTNLSKGEKSMQRSMQLHTEEPLQVFYSSDFTITSIEKNDNFVAANAAKKNSANSLSSFDGDLRLLLFPEHQNQILIRLENLSDLFDGVPTETSYFNLLDYATEFYKANNGGATPTSIDIHERTLSNNQGMDAMKANKFKWKSVDSSNSRLAQAFEADADDFSQVQLQPQRIRLYRVVYNSDSAAKDPQILTE